ncbi:Tir chaperone protein (CesT) [Bordetella ansorpii]|uniref:Tir chaperone protein (CesT) n=1 Tax=Bordetella ansorpii TaxID=288768 RepID=A0A157S595_9BORD|nr:CesT family type III secretion system chaperone [Bordetella ansorpii]SAI65555.1 Tir chaperone protein (CesT) [Bordetella ansorpii]
MNTAEARDTVNRCLAAVWGEGNALDSAGTFEITSEEGVNILMEVAQDEAQLRLYAPIFATPDALSYRVLHEALALNLFQVPLAGACLAIDGRTGALVLNEIVALDGLQSEGFEAAIRKFIGTSVQAQGYLLAAKQEVEPLPENEPGAGVLPANLA